MDKETREASRNFYARYSEEFNSLPLLMQQYIRSLEAGAYVEPADLQLKDLDICGVFNQELYEIVDDMILSGGRMRDEDIPPEDYDRYVDENEVPYFAYHGKQAVLVSANVEFAEPRIQDILTRASRYGYRYVAFVSVET